MEFCMVKDQFSAPFRGLRQEDGERGEDIFPSPDCLVRDYILFLLGTTIFTNKSATRVSPHLLQLLDNVEDIGSYG
ncbi:hypothetical protein Sjap_021748 [Stephania japonica]|uniref:Uncharacterized protein n=1 Tax=Stephania japonica TaxID=461633 RepID=A0AAP0EN11_9MAGN